MISDYTMLQTWASSWTACTADPVELPWRRWIHAWTLCPSPCPPHSNRRSALWRRPCVSWTPSQLWLLEPSEEKQMFKITQNSDNYNVYMKRVLWGLCKFICKFDKYCGSFNFIGLSVVWIIDNKLDIQNTVDLLVEKNLEQLTNRLIRYMPPSVTQGNQ